MKTCRRELKSYYIAHSEKVPRDNWNKRKKKLDINLLDLDNTSKYLKKNIQSGPCYNTSTTFC